MQSEQFKKKISGVLFDLDGTLLDTLEDLYLSVNVALAECSYPSRSRDEIRRFVGNGVYHLVRRAMPQEEPSEEDLQHCLSIFRKHYTQHLNDHTAPYDGILTTLKALKDAGLTLAVISNKTESAVQELCNHFFPGLISEAVGDLPPRPNKPSPDGVYAALSQAGLDKEDCIYVGDTDVDIQTAKAAGLPVISVTWGFRDRGHLMNAGAKKMIDHPDDLLTLLGISK